MIRCVEAQDEHSKQTDGETSAEDKYKYFAPAHLQGATRRAQPRDEVLRTA